MSEAPAALRKGLLATPSPPPPPPLPVSETRRAHEVCAIELLIELTGWPRPKAREELKNVEWMYSKFGGMMRGQGKRNGDRGRVPEAWLVTKKCASYIRKQFAEHARLTPKGAAAAFRAAGPAAAKKKTLQPPRMAAILEDILRKAKAPSDIGAVRVFDLLAAKVYNTKHDCVKNRDPDTGLHRWQPAEHKFLEKLGEAAFDLGSSTTANVAL